MKSISIKKSLFIVAFGIIAGTFLVFTSCVKQKFDVPPINIPNPGLVANKTIDSLKLQFLPDTIGMMTIKTDIIIQGIIAGNDESGNIYKALYLQDTTGGISIALNLTGLYSAYPVGQKVFIKCKGLYLGLYGGAFEIGYPYSGKIGQIPSTMIPAHLFASGLPGTPPQPVNIDASNMPSSAVLSKLTCSLVAFNNVKFPQAGLPFVDPLDTYTSTSRDMADSTGKLVSPNTIVYTSKYANFKGTLLPHGIGTLQGILTVYNGKYEMLVRDSLDIVGFHGTKK